MKVCSVCRRCYDDTVLSCTEENHESLIETRVPHAEIVPNYRLESLEETTPAGDIYRAASTILNKPYLIQIVAPETFDDAARKQFLSEAQALSTIIHPNVVRVFESGTLADGSLYAVTEFLTAQSLRECLTNVGAPSEVTALTITRQAAEGLEALHAVGVVHRGVKPENILLTADAENRFLIKLQNIDFGALRQTAVIANPEPHIHDLRYFSPEQCASETADAQTDVYALGIVLYEALAGRVPFDSPYADALLKKQISEQPPEIKIHSFDIRMLLTHTLTDALQKQTRTRLKSANALARRIRHIEQLATHSSTPPPAVAYPATMNKAAVVFTPQAKVESVQPAVPLKVETIEENPPLVQNIETFMTEEPPAVAEDSLPLPENPAEVESAPVVEAQSAFENPPVVEESETPLAVEAETFGENPPVAENPVMSENPPDDAEPAFDETPATVEYAFEAEPLVEEFAAAETPVAALEENPSQTPTALEVSPEAPPVIEEISAEIETVIESAPPVEAAEAAFEDSLTAEASTIEDLPTVEAQAAFEAVIPAEEPVSLEDQPVIEVVVEPQPEEAVSVEAQSEEEAIIPAETAEPIALENVDDAIPVEAATEEAETVLIDYTTTKLPPVETIVGKRVPENIVITEIEPIFSLKRGLFDIHKTSEPVLVDWEQPDDVPTTTQALTFSRKELADSAFLAPKADFIDDEDDRLEADSPLDSEFEDDEPHRARAAERPVFSYDDSRTSWHLPKLNLPEWNLPDRGKVLKGAGVLTLLAVAVGGTLLSRQLWTARSAGGGGQTTAQSSTTDKTLPKPAEPVKVTETTPPAAVRTETTPVSNPSTDDAALPELPSYQPRGETEARTALPALTENRGKKRVLKEAVEKLERATQETKTAATSAPVFDKKGNLKPPPTDKKSPVKNQVSTPAKTDIFTRPRIVKTQ